MICSLAASGGDGEGTSGEAVSEEEVVRGVRLSIGAVRPAPSTVTHPATVDAIAAKVISVLARAVHSSCAGWFIARPSWRLGDGRP